MTAVRRCQLSVEAVDLAQICSDPGGGARVSRSARPTRRVATVVKARVVAGATVPDHCVNRGMVAELAPGVEA